MELDPVYNHHCKKLLVAAISVTAICTQLTTIMAIKTDKAEKETACWNEQETQQFIQFLVDHKSEGGDGGTFKNKTMGACQKLKLKVNNNNNRIKRRQADSNVTDS